MSTRSTIGVELDNGTVISIYCHWDGYPEHNGVILADYYDEAKTLALIAGGDVSSLCKNLTPPVGVEHSFKSPDDDTTVFYHRDRGEAWRDIRPKTYNNRDDYYVKRGCMIEYRYLLRSGGKWEVQDCYTGEVRVLDDEYINKLRTM